MSTMSGEDTARRCHSALPVSVIVPCWCCASTIAATVDSVLAQSKSPAEIILVDDASPDHGKTRAALQMQARRSNDVTAVHVVLLNQNSGPGGARNAGWARATQPYIAFIDADDVWHPSKLELQMAWMSARPSVAMTGHATTTSADVGALALVRAQFHAERVSLWKMLISNRFPTRSVVLRADIPARFGGKQVTEDYLLWLEIIAVGYECWQLETVLAYSLRPEFDPGGYSGDLWTHERRELRALHELREQRHIGIITSWIATGWSIAKYARRVVLQWLRHL